MSIFSTTNGGMTLLGLAKKTATRSHPNYALIRALTKKIREAGGEEAERGLLDLLPARVSSEDTADSPSRVKKRSIIKRVKRSGKCTRNPGQVAVKEEEDFEDPANLLLHFSRNSSSPSKRYKVTQFAEI